MRIPSRVTIKKGVVYDVVYQDGVEGNHSLWGICCDVKRQITIDLNASTEKKWSTFVHELLHAFEFEYKIPIPHRVIYRLETAIFGFLKANFKLE